MLTVAPSIHHGAPKKLDDLPMPTVVTSNSQEAIIERTERVGVGVGIQKTICFTSDRCGNKMLDKCSLSPHASIMGLRKTPCFTSADCRNKDQSWIWSMSMSISFQIPDLQKTGCVASARCRHKLKSRSSETFDALQVLTVVTSINHGTAN